RSFKVSRRIERVLDLRNPSPGLVPRTTWVAIIACALPLVYSAAALQVARPPAERPTSPGLAQLLTDGSKMTAADALQIEQLLIRDPEDLDARARLISYYYATDRAHPRLEHVYWLI